MTTHKRQLVCRLGLFVALLVGLLGAATAQDAAPSVDEPLAVPERDREVVQRTEEALSESFQTIQNLRERLLDLGSPAKRLEGETDQRYVERVELVFRARAMYVHLLHQEVARLIEAKHTLQNKYRHYETWLARAKGVMVSRPAQYEARIAELNKEIDGYFYDIVVLADLIKREAEEEDRPDLVKEMEELYTVEWLEAVPDAEERAEKFASLPLEGLGSKMETLKRLRERSSEAQDAINILQNAVGEARGIGDELPKAHLAVFERLTNVLHRNQEQLARLETTAGRISVLAGITRDNLDLVRPEKLRKNGQIDEEAVDRLERDQASIEQSLDAVKAIIPGVGGDVPLQTNKDLRRTLEEWFSRKAPGASASSRDEAESESASRDEGASP